MSGALLALLLGVLALVLIIVGVMALLYVLGVVSTFAVSVAESVRRLLRGR